MFNAILTVTSLLKGFSVGVGACGQHPMKPVDSTQTSNRTVRVRLFCPESDLASCIEIYYRTRRETFSWVPRLRFKRSDFLVDTLEEDIFVADVDGKVAAFAGLCAPERFLHHLYVVREHQRCGVGSLLLQHVLALSGGQLRLKCLCRNRRALAFYRGQDWREGEHGRDAFGKWVMLQSPATPRLASPNGQWQIENSQWPMSDYRG